MDVQSVAPTTEMVKCFRHEGEDCHRCDGSGYRPRKRCAGCGKSASCPSKGGKAFLGLKNNRDQRGPFYCMVCHPEMNRGGLAMLDGLERSL